MAGVGFSNSGKPEPEEGQHASAALKRALFITAIGIFVLIAGAAMTATIPIESRPDFALTMYFAIKQDIPVATIALLVVLGLCLASDRALGVAGGPAKLKLSGLRAFAVILLPPLVAFVVRQYVFRDYDMSRDEQMVTFDTAIFASGKLFQTIPLFWRQFYEALNVAFILPIGDREAWVSGYLPGNAALRAALGAFLPASAVSPLLLLVAILALWRTTVRLWPDSASTRAVVMLLFVGSSQAVLMATANYAMTAHLALNSVWLWLFLKRKPLAHVVAIVVGFVATGLHQPLFHPFFVAPFLLLLWREKAWKELLAYVSCYGAIGLFWLGWQPWISSHGLHIVTEAHSGSGVNYLERIRHTVKPVTADSFWVMAANLLRFVTWNHFLLVPLGVLAMTGDRAREPFVQALWLGMALVIVFMTIMLPAQVNGWGYRYLHGFLGNVALLAGIAWHSLDREGVAPVKPLLWITALCTFVVLPLHGWMADRQIAGYADAAFKVRAIDADVVIVDAGVPFSSDLVLNRADLTNRPILLSRSYLRPADMPLLCRDQTLAFADAPMLVTVSRYFDIPKPERPTTKQSILRQAAAAAGCRIVPALPARGA